MNPPLKNTLLAATALFALAQPAQAALMINMGLTTTDGQGPSGADTAWNAYTTPSASTNTGQLTTYNSTTFAGVTGAYNVGVQFIFNGTTGGRRSIDRNTTANGNNNFYNNWVGFDGASGTGITTMTLTFTGLPANTSFVLTSYHYDANDQKGKFTTSLTGTQQFSIGNGAAVKTNFIYDFSLTSNNSGTATIDYINVSSGSRVEQFMVMNGLELNAIPEPTTALLGSLGMFFLLRRRRQAM